MAVTQKVGRQRRQPPSTAFTQQETRNAENCAGTANQWQTVCILIFPKKICILFYIYIYLYVSSSGNLSPAYL